MKTIAEIGDRCCGCGACAQACGRGAITFAPDGEGFFQPRLDTALCVDCGQCLKVCPMVAAKPGHMPQAVYAAAALSPEVLSGASSGGVFRLAAQEILRQGGVVYGAALEESDWTVGITCAQEESTLARLCGSKYVQALPSQAYKEIRQRLQKGGKVLFAGCPCQVAALKAFLGENTATENLTLMDIVCHGAPSPGAFQAYQKWLSKREGGCISGYRFRAKERGWGKTIGYRVGERQVLRNAAFDPYNSSFFACDNFRACCYACPFAKGERQGDLTLGDYWGIMGEHPEFDAKDGVSLVLMNTEKGGALLEKIGTGMRCIPSTLEKASRRNENLRQPTQRPAGRGDFYTGLYTLPPEKFVRRQMKIKPHWKDVVKAMVPWSVRDAARKIIRRGKNA